MREAVEQLDRRDRQPARADHRAAPAGARRSSAWRRRSTTLAQRTARRPAGSRSHATSSSPTSERLAPELETTVYRVVQEALTNVVKHARRRIGRARACAATATRSSRASPTTASASTPTRAGARLRAGRACASASSWPAASSTSRRGAGRRDRRPRAAARWLSGYSASTKPVVERVADELGARGAAELLLDVRAVGLDGAHREVELLRRSRRSCGPARSGAGPRPRAR